MYICVCIYASVTQRMQNFLHKSFILQSKLSFPFRDIIHLYQGQQVVITRVFFDASGTTMPKLSGFFPLSLSTKQNDCKYFLLQRFCVDQYNDHTHKYPKMWPMKLSTKVWLLTGKKRKIPWGTEFLGRTSYNLLPDQDKFPWSNMIPQVAT